MFKICVLVENKMYVMQGLCAVEVAANVGERKGSVGISSVSSLVSEFSRL